MTLSERHQLLTEFIIEKHKGQLRKYTNTPYHEHPIRVAHLAVKYHKSNHLFLFEIGLCHDLFEDTDCTYEELYKFLVKKLKYDCIEANIICNAVERLTNQYTQEKYPELTRKTRKELELEKLANMPSYCQNIKYADIIDNISSIVKYDKKFAKTYIQEKIELLNVMRNGCVHLFIKCCAAINAAQEELQLSE